MKDNIVNIIVSVIVIGVLASYIYIEASCWNIPIAQRSGMCALLH
jgi:hypothetical protein